MDPVWISVAFAFGWMARQAGLPPLIGFLFAGFTLNALGVESGDLLEVVSDLGVSLLLFTIGLKLRITTLLRPEVWAGTSLHMVAVIGLLGGALLVLGLLGFPDLVGIGWRECLFIAFALSFSSTVFAVKVLEEKGEMTTRFGRLGIGILVMQDLLAVLFLAFSADKVPSPWALLLLGLPLLRPGIMALLARCGHGELLVLFGFAMAFVGTEGFERLGVKADLGALVLGALLASHPKSGELSYALLGFKDLFLVGFFLSIGFAATPSMDSWMAAGLLVALLPLKVTLLYMILLQFKLRARTSFLVSLSLANFSEFGLILAKLGVEQGWLAKEWLVVLSLALSVSFLIASPLNASAHRLYQRWSPFLRRYEREERLPDDRILDPGEAQVVVFGMGRIGAQAYDWIVEHHGPAVVGLDSDSELVDRHRKEGRRVFRGDATDCDFWDSVRPGNVRLVMLTMPDHSAVRFAVQQLKGRGYTGSIAATARFDDQVDELKSMGVDAALNLFREAGAGFASHALERLAESR